MNLLGVREKDVYGTMSCDKMFQYIYDKAEDIGVEAHIVQKAT